MPHKGMIRTLSTLEEAVLWINSINKHYLNPILKEWAYHGVIMGLYRAYIAFKG